MNQSLLTNARKGPENAPGARRACVPTPVHRYATPTVREMTPAETEAQRRLVRASILAKPV